MQAVQHVPIESLPCPCDAMVRVRIEVQQRQDDVVHLGNVVVHGHFSVCIALGISGDAASGGYRGSLCKGDGARGASCIGVWFREAIGSALAEAGGYRRAGDGLKSLLPKGSGQVTLDLFGNKDRALTWRQEISRGTQDFRGHHEGPAVEVRAKRVPHPPMHRQDHGTGKPLASLERAPAFVKALRCVHRRTSILKGHAVSITPVEPDRTTTLPAEQGDRLRECVENPLDDGHIYGFCEGRKSA